MASQLKWVTAGRNTSDAQKVMRDFLLNQKNVQSALAKHVNSLDLQGQINKGIITEHQALTLLEKAVMEFKNNLATQINELFTRNGLDQTNLALPVNMENALQNPDSFASQTATDATASLEADQLLIAQINEEVQNSVDNLIQTYAIEDEEDAMQLQQVMEEEQTADMQAQQTSEEESRGAMLAELVKSYDDNPEEKATKDLIEEAVHELTGKEGSFEKLAEETMKQDTSITPVPKPKGFDEK